jgi:glycosyltransferase involved in cell wall biosynthesis
MTTAQPLVSAVVPAYNASRTVVEAVNSILTQTVGDLEVIVVDDGSRDDTADVVRSIDDPRVSLITKQNEGASSARNAGIRAARGRYVAFLDADDQWLPSKLERQLDVLESDPGVYAVQSGALLVDDAMKPLSVLKCRPWKDALWDVLMFQNLPAFSSTFIAARDKLMERDGFDTSLVILEDWELAIHAVRHWKFQSIDDPLTLYRTHPGNRSIDVSLHIEPGEKVLRRLFSDPSMPPEILARKRRVYARFYTMLAGGAFRCRRWSEWIHWTRRALRTDPLTLGYMMEMPLRRLRRRPSGYDPVV